MDEAGRDAIRRYEAALANGPLTACPADGRPAPAAFPGDLAAIKGRPLFRRIEEMAARALAARGPEVRWSADAADVDAVEADARDLSSEIAATRPGVGLVLVSSDDLIAAQAFDGADDAAARVRRAAEQVLPEESAARASAAAKRIFGAGLTAASTPSAEMFGPEARAGVAADAPLFALVVAQSPLVDQKHSRDSNMREGLAGLGVEAACGVDSGVDPTRAAQAMNDHELAHVLSYAEALMPRRSDRYGVYREECAADAFVVLRALARGGADERTSGWMRRRRDVAAAAEGDADHWTSPTIAMARERGEALLREGRLAGMGARELIRESDRIARDSAMSPLAFADFQRDLAARRSGAEMSAPADPQAQAAGRAAVLGYARARVERAAPLARDADLDAHQARLRAANPDRAEAYDLGLANLRLERAAHAAGASAAGGAPASASTARPAARALEIAAGLLAAARRRRGRETLSAEVKTLAAARGRAAEIARQDAVRGRDAATIAAASEAAADALSAAPELAGAAKSLRRMSREIGQSLPERALRTAAEWRGHEV